MPKIMIILSIVVLMFRGLLALPVQQVAQAAAPSGQIAYVGSEGDVWIMEAASGQTRRVTSDFGQGVSYHSPRFSPDGRFLAYCRIFSRGDENSLPDSAIYMTTTSDLSPVRLIGEAACGFSWSPDSRSILYGRPLFVGIPVSEDHVPGGIYSYDLESSVSTQVIAAGERMLADPVWSPDGSWFSFYEACFECVGQFTTVQAQTGARYDWSVNNSDQYVGTGTSWSPDGKHLAFDKIVYPYIEPGQTSGLYVGVADGSDRWEIYRSDSQVAGFPLWSHDGSKIAFTQFTGILEDNTWMHRGDLMVVTPNGSDPSKKYSWSKALFPKAWSPDDNHLLFIALSEDSWSINHLMMLSLDTGAVENITDITYQDVDWGPLPAASPDLPPPAVQNIPQDALGLLYLSGDQSLSLFFPQTGASLRLSEPSTEHEFTASPSRRRVVLGQQLISLEFDQAGQLVTKAATLQTNPKGLQIHWSPDEMRLAYQGEDDRVWIENLAGSAQLMSGAATPPVWSHDGEWIAYCDDQKTLWVSGSNNLPVEVAHNVVCYPEWSSSQTLLAYTLDGEFTPDTHQAWVYDPAKQSSVQVFAGGSIEHWSPDGKLLAISRMDVQGASAATYTIFSTDPNTNAIVELGQFYTRDLGSQRWIPVEEAYFFGRFQIAPDSGSAIEIADPLYDVSIDGQRILASNGSLEATNLICRDSDIGGEHTLLTADLSGLVGAQMPGLWAWFSPNGQWISISQAAGGMNAGLLSRCDGTGKINTPAEYYSIRGKFSPDSHWYVINPYPEDQNDIGQLHLYGLDTGTVQMLASTGMAEVYWLQTPKYAPPQTYQVSGRVLDSDGLPVADVTILVDGTPAAVTNEDGSYHLSGLSQGSHSILAQAQAESFPPNSKTISVPPDNQTLDITVSGSQPKGQPEETIVPEAAAEMVTPEAGGLLTAKGESGTGGLGMESEIGMSIMYLLLILLVLFFATLIAGVVFLLWSRRQTAQTTQSVTIPNSPLPSEKALLSGPGQNTGQAPQDKGPLNSMVLEGERLIREGNFVEGKKILSQVIQKSPDHAQAWYLIGWAAAQQGDIRTAERCLLQAEKFGNTQATGLLGKLRSGPL